FQVDVGEHDAGASRGQRLSDRLAEPRPASRHDHDPAIQPRAHLVLPWSAVQTRAMKPWNSLMKFFRNSSTCGSVTSPSSVISPGTNWMYASIEFMSGALQNAMMLRRCDCATAVPIF